MVVGERKMTAEVPPRILWQLVKRFLCLWEEVAGKLAIGL